MASPHINSADKRRAPRFRADLLVMIEGLHDDFSLVRGDISTTGVLLELPSAPGSPGDLELLHLSTPDRTRRVSVMGQIVRCLTVSSMGASLPLVAVAFELLPERPETRSELQKLVQHIVSANQQSEDFTVDFEVPVELEPLDEGPKAATVFRLQVKRMALETTWPLNLGDRVQLTFKTGSARLPFEGEVISVAPRDNGPTPTYRVEVSLGELGERTEDSAERPRSLTESLDLILSDLVTADLTPPEPSQRHLSGRLDRIALTSLLTFLEMERQSGQLVIRTDDHTTTVFLDQGSIVDLTPPSDNPVQQLESVLPNRDGRFEFTCEPIDRPDRLQIPITHLLLDWARRQDEDNA